jgi:hypothetical protein
VHSVERLVVVEEAAAVVAVDERERLALEQVAGMRGTQRGKTMIASPFVCPGPK